VPAARQAIAAVRDTQSLARHNCVISLSPCGALDSARGR